MLPPAHCVRQRPFALPSHNGNGFVNTVLEANGWYEITVKRRLFACVVMGKNPVALNTEVSEGGISAKQNMVH